jgi:hypothetical protein
MSRDAVSVLTPIAIAIAFCILLMSVLLALAFGEDPIYPCLDSLCICPYTTAGSITWSNICTTSGVTSPKVFGIADPLASTTTPPTANSIKVRYFQKFFVMCHGKIMFSSNYATDLPIV